MIISADGLFTLPPDADPRQLAMLAINPTTAALLLSEYVNLKQGEWVVQNAANSGVGRWGIAIGFEALDHFALESAMDELAYAHRSGRAAPAQRHRHRLA